LKLYGLTRRERRRLRKEQEARESMVKTVITSDKINDQLSVRHAIHPMWVFADVNKAKWTNHMYWCFVGCNYPDGIQTYQEAQYTAAHKFIVSGDFMKQQDGLFPNRKKGWANAETPDEAFKQAIKMAGYLGVQG
jgi:hypothetical protein